MKQPAWYTATENFLLKHGKWPITIGLGVTAGVSAYFLWKLWAEDKGAVPAAAWVTYVFMP